ncbi:hypothetical protein MTO96_001424 [Rhipicephalus appendiculatus]
MCPVGAASTEITHARAAKDGWRKGALEERAAADEEPRKAGAPQVQCKGETKRLGILAKGRTRLGRGTAACAKVELHRRRPASVAEMSSAVYLHKRCENRLTGSYSRVSRRDPGAPFGGAHCAAFCSG